MPPTRALSPLLFSLFIAAALAAEGPAPAAAATAASHPDVATKAYSTRQFLLALRTDTQTLARLDPVADPSFDFTPGPREAERQYDGYAHIGDLNLRLRNGGAGAWREFSSSSARQPIKPLAAGGKVLAAADITATMGKDLPLTVERRWLNEGGALVLRFTLINNANAPVEIGGLGMPMVFDNIITDRTLEQAHASASFADPYIGRDAGYVQVTRLNGQGPALIVTPDGRTPLEAWRPLTDRSPRAQTSEGFYDWTVASKAYAENEWKNAGEQWNAPTSITLEAGARRDIGVRFATAPSIRAIEAALIAQKRPVAVGIPGYVVPTDLEATLFLKSPQKVVGITSYPENALAVTPDKSSAKGWARYTVRANGWGPARLSIAYADGGVQTVSYFVTKPLEQAVADLGKFSTTQQWFDDKKDPFKRAPAILTYDRDAKRIVTDDPRVWISGMSDEGGGGSWVAAISKQLDNPDPAEVAKLERLVNETVVGKLQVADGPQAGAVRKSLFYYDPKSFPSYYNQKANWGTWASWTKKDADDLGRAYNYPHVAIGHWVLYRLARNHVGLVTAHDWRWYLNKAYQTTVAMVRDAPECAQFGLMEGDVFVDILKDLQREGMTAEATDMEAMMKRRADHWRTLAYPFGSEMAWDSTGQAEVYAWMRHFGYAKQADITREVILGYDPAMPSWGYNGNARRYWDFLYGGKTARIERQIHHYGSTLNAVPLFDAYRANPSDLHLLRVAYGGLLGGITNIDRDGFSSAAFHAWPDMMRWDAYSGDYGMGFYGHAYASATYVLKDPTFGWLSFGGNMKVANNGVVQITPKDSARTRLFVAPARAWITLEAGKIDSAAYDPKSRAITLELAAATAATPAARLLVESPGGKFKPQGLVAERGGYRIPLTASTTRVLLKPR
ncbi:hypothetical protein SAMN05428959_1011254 [Duganella sp. CF517]|uniref:DUF5695 domain-containing protein n=1 Tax=Duganella sp. CF517 TaxID=1881038 RepID=UPI0008D3A98C|nr:DUF5695 domain-containing protein [Duganella sp. CF517]SEN33957.1 hypothetical protein SAMN05428959_1011254 [Duganella sp. CF517]